MKYKINGTTLTTLDLHLDNGESVFTESGGMAWIDSNIEMKTSTRGGFLKGVGWMLGGESLFLVSYRADGAGKITFASEFPGCIIPIKLSKGEEIICQKDSFLCAEDSINLEMYFRKKLGVGLVGGEGFIMQKITGPGVVFFEIDGDVSELNLKKGETIKVDTGHIALYEPSVDFSVTTVKGFKNILFGGEGLFLATLTGPGKVWLQSMPIRKFSRKLLSYMPITSGGRGKRAGINFGNILERV